MKLVKKLVTLIILSLIVVIMPINIIPLLNTTQTVEASTIKINKKTAKLTVGDTLQLKVSGTKSKIKWWSNKKSVATVSSTGKVTAKKKGTAYIVAEINGEKYKCKVTVEAEKISDESLGTYAWILLETKYNDGKVTINKIQTGKDKDTNEKAIIINFTYNSRKAYAYIRLRDGNAQSYDLIPIYQLESDDFPNQHLNLNTFSSLENLEDNAEIGETLNLKDIKKLYNQYKEEDNYIVIS